MSLEFQAALWLKYEKQICLVLFERTPRYHHGQPDVLGITESRYLYEIEVKRSVSDFRANAKKHHIRNREALPEMAKHFPKQFWFLVPGKLVEKIRDEVPTWAGLLAVDEDPGDAGHGTPIRVKSIKPAPVNKESQKLSLKECAKLLRNIGNQMISDIGWRHYAYQQQAIKNDDHFNDEYFSKKLVQGEFGNWVWVPNPDYLNFQI